MLDTLRAVHTPEGVDLHLPVAGPLLRAVAWGIDAMIRLAVVISAAAAFGMMESTGVGWYLVALFVVLWLYPVVFEAMWNGQTPGKRAMRLRVVRDDGAPVGWLGAFVRNLLRTVDMLPFGYAIGVASGLLDPWGRRLGDLVAGTVVVHVPTLPVQAQMHASDGIEAPILAVPLRPAEQAALIAFGERAPALTLERQEELSDLLLAMTGATGVEGLQRVRAHADYLMGR